MFWFGWWLGGWSAALSAIVITVALRRFGGISYLVGAVGGVWVAVLPMRIAADRLRKRGALYRDENSSKQSP